MGRFLDPTSTSITIQTCVPGRSDLAYQGTLPFSKCIFDFYVPGANTWTVPAGGSGNVTFEIWGAGGGGGAKCCCDCGRGGPGGGGGGYVSYQAKVTAGEVYNLYIGNGGMVTTAGQCTNHNCCFGGDGETSYIVGPAMNTAGVTLCSTGGQGGHNCCKYGYGVQGGIGYAVGAANTVVQVANGSSSSYQSYSPTCGCWHNHSVSGGANRGGASQMQVADWWWKNQQDGSGQPNAWPGIYPGGGGSTPQSFNTCGCSTAGVGANGLIRIKF